MGCLVFLDRFSFYYYFYVRIWLRFTVYILDLFLFNIEHQSERVCLVIEFFFGVLYLWYSEAVLNSLLIMNSILFVLLSQSVLEGYNGTVMAYGQTGTGKTYTLGRLGDEDTSARGIMVRAMEDILANISPETDSISVSFLQVAQATYMLEYWFHHYAHLSFSNFVTSRRSL